LQPANNTVAPPRGPATLLGGFDGVIVNNAANSSVARLFTPSADHRQISTISVVRSADRAHELAARYPNVPVVSTESPDWVGQIRNIADGRPIPVALDPVGETISGHLLSLLSSGGTLITDGAMAQENIPLRTSALLGREIGLRGLTVGRLAQWRPRTPGLRHRRSRHNRRWAVAAFDVDRHLHARSDHRCGPARQPPWKEWHRDRQNLVTIIRCDKRGESDD